MYEKCLVCNKLGAMCDGPNFMAMPITDLVNWCNARRKQRGLSYDKIAEKTGISKGTISGFFGGDHANYRIETIRPILKLLVGCEWDDNPCADMTTSERGQYEERIRQLEEEKRQLEKGTEWRDDKIQHFKELVAINAADSKNQIDFLKKRLDQEEAGARRLKIAISVVCGVAVIGVIVALFI